MLVFFRKQEDGKSKKKNAVIWNLGSVPVKSKRSVSPTQCPDGLGRPPSPLSNRFSFSEGQVDGALIQTLIT
jgi:hypothetical protein